MASHVTGKNGSRVTQGRKRRVLKAKPGPKPKNIKLTVDDFDLNKNLNGNSADPAEGREARLPIVIRGMRHNRSIREIAFEADVSPATIAKDKIFVLNEAWELRQDLVSLWLEEQLQQYERMLGLLDKELMVESMIKEGKGEDAVWTPKLDSNGKPVIVTDKSVMGQMLAIMDKVNELKGLKQAPVNLGIQTGDNANISINKDADAAVELLDFLKSGEMGTGKKALIS